MLNFITPYINLVDLSLLLFFRIIYIESMGKTLQNLFKSYCAQLLKLDLLMATKNDLIAVEEASLKSVFTSKVFITKITERLYL